MARLGMSPADLDPLEAASAPLMPDPMAGGGRVGRHVRATVAASNNRDEAHRVLTMQLMEEGYPASEAARIAARDLAVDAFDSNRSTPAAPAAQVGRPAAPSSMGPRPQMDPGPAPLAMTEPGVRMPDGSRVTPPQAIYDEQEAAAYNIRTPDGAGWYKPSGRDKAMAARGYVPVENQDGSVSYRLGPSGGVDNLPGTPGRGGRRDDLEAPMVDAQGKPMLDANGDPIPLFRVRSMPGPISENNLVYVLSDEARAKNAAQRRESQLYRDAKIQGVSPAALLAANPGDYGDLTAGGQRDRVNARAANEGARQAAAAKREEAWRAQMMLGGGRPTGGIGGSKATVNAWLNLPEEQRASAMRYMLPGGQLSATVDANNAAQAGRMAQAAMTAFLNGQNSGQLNPLQQQQLNQMQSQLPAAEQVPLHKDKPGVHQSELKYADDYVGTHYSSGGGVLGVSSEFTMAEQQSVIDHLVNDMGYAPAKAQKIVDEIARRRNAGSWMG
jgi:hypothetical protein